MARQYTSIFIWVLDCIHLYFKMETDSFSVAFPSGIIFASTVAKTNALFSLSSEWRLPTRPDTKHKFFIHLVYSPF